MHALRDPRGHGRGVRSIPRAGVLLKKRPPPPDEWWQSYFDADYLREFAPLFTAERDRKEVARLVEVLGLPAGAKLLDVPCGQGRHSHLLAESGFDVTGLDYSEYLLERARRRGEGPTLRYEQGDMRKLPKRWTGRFHAVLNLFTSFGFFLDPADDARVLAEFARVLEPGGILVWHGGNRDGVMTRFLARDWWETADGTLVAQERSFDALSGVLTVRSVWRDDRERAEREHRIRLYTPTRIAEMCAAVGLIVEEGFDSWEDRPLTRRTSNMMLVARKDDSPERPDRPAPGSRGLPGRRGAR